MDFITWCDFVLVKLIELSRQDSMVRSIGVDHWQFSRFLLEGNPSRLETYDGSTIQKGIIDATANLQNLGLVELDSYSSHWKVSKDGKAVAADSLPLWLSICQEKLEPEHQQLLLVINHLSPHHEDDHA